MTSLHELHELAYITMVTTDSFVMGAEAMIYSLRATGTKHAVVVMVTPQVSGSKRAQLKAAGASSVLEVAPIANPSAAVNAGASWVNSGYTKLHLWNLVQFSKLVYIDADTIVLENVDELFERPSPAFAPDVFPPDKLNAGVIVVEPDAARRTRT